MKPELDKKLVEDFPILYQQRYEDKKTTCMYWGFECGDGWEPLIRRLSGKLEAWNNEYPDQAIIATQVKEKFGTLRFYYFVHSDYASEEEYKNISDLVDRAEAESAITCEKCGKPGKLRGTGWVLTLCDECYEEWKERR